ncbi:MAG: hypothetical protein SVC26_05870, partial [Pseudomonadota bacterium]|nr:hypothetical protein [Pseudomonadota bacterium]
MKFLTKKAAARLRKYEIKEAAADIFYTTTPDGWELAISHYQPQENVEQKPTPVLLCHGLGSNRITFDIDEQNSLVKPLLQAGYKVYSMELRGHGLSQKAG